MCRCCVWSLYLFINWPVALKETKTKKEKRSRMVHINDHDFLLMLKIYSKSKHIIISLVDPRDKIVDNYPSLILKENL